LNNLATGSPIEISGKMEADGGFMRRRREYKGMTQVGRIRRVRRIRVGRIIATTKSNGGKDQG